MFWAFTCKLSGRDRDGMMSVALTSGGDYVSAGTPACSVKTACEAPRAGLCKDLCKTGQIYWNMDDQ